MSDKNVQDANDSAVTLEPPAGLGAKTFSVDGDEYVLFAFPLAKLRPLPGLTLAEHEVVRWVVEGLANKDIARRRGTSTNTVANQLRSIYEKLGLSNRLELVRMAARTAAVK